MIKLDSLVKRYDQITALNGVSLNVEPGEFIALLGPNGAGKTTIIRILLDFTRPTSGTAFVNGLPSTSSDARRIIGYLPENIRIPPYLTGRQFLKRQAQLCDLQGKESDTAIDRILETVNMNDRQHSQTRGYSKGMLQRLGLAAALLCSPKLLILDEPTNGLDPIGIREFRMILEKLKEQKVTLILNSHILSEVEHLCTVAAIMNKGQILVKDSISNLVQNGETLEDVFIRYVSGL